MALDTTIPSTRALQRLIADSHMIEVKLITGDVFRGTILWQDPECLCLVVSPSHKILVWRSAIAFVGISASHEALKNP